MEYYSVIKRNTCEPVLRRWVNLESIIQSEVGQKEKHKYGILTYIYGIQKDGTDEICRAAVKTDIENRLMDTERGRDERVGRMVRVTWKLTLPCVHQTANGKLLYDSGNSDWTSVTTQRGGRLNKEGIYTYMYTHTHTHTHTHTYIHTQDCFTLMFGRNQHNSVNQVSFNLKINLTGHR